jgi:hypothetical protein
MMICGVIGQLITVGFAIAEVRFRGYINFASMAVIIGLLVIAGVGAIVSAIKTAGSYLGKRSEPAGLSSDHLRSIVEKFSSISPETAFARKGSDLFTPHERQTIENLVGGPKPGLQTWRMF